MANDRASILARMKALSQRTTANGCTEAEALHATQKLGELADRYGFSMEDVAETEREPIGEETWFADSKQLGPVSSCALAIAAFCDCKVWCSWRYVEMMGETMQHVVYFGRESDGMIATYLTHLFHTAIKNSWAEFCAAHSGKDMRPRRKSFMVGMTNRISERLYDMKAARNVRVYEPEEDAAEASGQESVAEATGKSRKTGNDLAVVKNAEVEAAFALLGMRLKVTRGRKFKSNYEAYAAGREAGDRVGIHAGITHGSSQARIGYG
jgi:hypothetical protein